MPDLVAGLLLVLHGLVHPAIYAIPQDPSKPAPFDPRRSWALAARGADATIMRRASIILAWATASAYGAAGSMLLLGMSWVAAGLVAAVAGLALKTAWFHPWLVLGLGIDVAVLAVVLGGGSG